MSFPSPVHMPLRHSQSPGYMPLRHSQSPGYMPFHPSQSRMHAPLRLSGCCCSYSSKVHFVKNILKWPSVVKPVLPISVLFSFLDIFFINICAEDLCENVFNKHQFCFKTMFLNVWKRWYTMNECLKSEKKVKRWLIKHFPFVFVFCYLLLVFPSNH